MLHTVIKNSPQCHQRPLERARRGFSLRLHLVSCWPRPAAPRPPIIPHGWKANSALNPCSAKAFPLLPPPPSLLLETLGPPLLQLGPPLLLPWSKTRGLLPQNQTILRSPLWTLPLTTTKQNRHSRNSSTG